MASERKMSRAWRPSERASEQAGGHRCQSVDNEVPGEFSMKFIKHNKDPQCRAALAVAPAPAPVSRRGAAPSSSVPASLYGTASYAPSVPQLCSSVFPRPPLDARSLDALIPEALTRQPFLAAVNSLLPRPFYCRVFHPPLFPHRSSRTSFSSSFVPQNRSVSTPSYPEIPHCIPPFPLNHLTLRLFVVSLAVLPSIVSVPLKSSSSYAPYFRATSMRLPREPPNSVSAEEIYRAEARDRATEGRFSGDHLSHLANH